MLVLKLICIFFQCLPYLLLLQTNFLRKVVGRGKRLGLQMCWLLPRYYATLLRIYNSKTVTGEIIALETKKPWYVDILPTTGGQLSDDPCDQASGHTGQYQVSNEGCGHCSPGWRGLDIIASQSIFAFRRKARKWSILLLFFFLLLG